MVAQTRTPRSTWIDAGLKALAAGGPDAVRVELLAKALGVTRGGFYWHFPSRQAFLDEMLDTWEHRSTEEVLERVEEEGGDARDKVRRAGMLTFSKELLPIDLAVRDWARRDRSVAKRLRRVDNRRMEYLRMLDRRVQRRPRRRRGPRHARLLAGHRQPFHRRRPRRAQPTAGTGTGHTAASRVAAALAHRRHLDRHHGHETAGRSGNIAICAQFRAPEGATTDERTDDAQRRSCCHPPARPGSAAGPGVLRRQARAGAREERPGGLLYRCASGVFALFKSAGASPGTFTQMSCDVDDLEATVAELRSRGVVFEEVRRARPDHCRRYRRSGGQLSEQGLG